MKTEIIKVDREDFDPQKLEEAAKTLREGGVVAFPTETVYGLGANRDAPAVIEELSRIKKRPPEKHYTIHISNEEEIEKYASSLPKEARRVIDVYWPGPLTIVLPGREEETVGLRLPAHKVARELIRRAGVPIIAPSANPSGQEPATTAEEVLDYFQGQIPFVVDGGPSPLRQSSTVVKFEEGQWTLLREGIITKKMIKKLIDVTILFVCTGNTCRSPVAERLLKEGLAERLEIPLEELDEHGYHIASAGISAHQGAPASENSRVLVQEQGGDLSSHRSQQLTRGMMEKADYLYVMTPGHYQHLVQVYPEMSEKIHLLDSQGISDPYGGDLEEYRKCFRQIQKSLDSIIQLICPAKISQG